MTTITGPCAYGAKMPIPKDKANDEAFMRAAINGHVTAMAKAQMADAVRDTLDVIIDGYELVDPANDPVQAEPRPVNLIWAIVRARIIERKED